MGCRPKRRISYLARDVLCVVCFARSFSLPLHQFFFFITSEPYVLSSFGEPICFSSVRVFLRTLLSELRNHRDGLLYSLRLFRALLLYLSFSCVVSPLKAPGLLVPIILRSERLFRCYLGPLPQYLFHLCTDVQVCFLNFVSFFASFGSFSFPLMF